MAFEMKNEIAGKMVELKRGRGRPRKVKEEEDENRASADVEYAEEMASTGNFRRRGLDLYEWRSERWARVSNDEGQVAAFSWLRQNRRDVATKQRADGCFGAVSLVVDKLTLISELTPARFIVPTRGMWLEIDVQFDERGKTTGGTIRKMKPTRELGVTGEVPIEIAGEDGERYVPREIDPDSHFGRFLASSFDPRCKEGVEKKENLEAIQEYAGYTLIPGSPNHQVAHLWSGPGGNGKGVMKALIAKFHEKYASVSLDNLDGFGIEHIQDATLAIVDETPRTFNPERLKSLISGDPMDLQRKHKMAVSNFRCGARWIINSNQDFGLGSVDSSPGFFRRFIIIKWTDSPSDAAKIAGIEELIFNNEAQAVLDWMLIGLLRFLENGHLYAPTESLRFKREALSAADSVLSWFEENGSSSMLQGENDKCMTRGTVYRHYREFCEHTGRIPLRDNAFWLRLKEHMKGLNTNTGAINKNGKFERYTNIDLNKAVVSELKRGVEELPRKKKATFKELFGKSFSDFDMNEVKNASEKLIEKILSNPASLSKEEAEEAEEIFSGFI